MRRLKLTLAHALLVLPWCPPVHAQLSTATDRNAFISGFPSHTRTGFDSLTAGTGAPFVSDGVEVSGTLASSAPQVTAGLAGFPHSFWFQGFGSPENYVMANDPGLQFVWTGPINAAGFDIQCLACDSAGNTSSLLFEAIDALGNSLGTIEQSVPLDSTVRFASVYSTVAFHALRVTRVQSPGTFGNYMIDDLRFASDMIFASGFEAAAGGE